MQRESHYKKFKEAGYSHLVAIIGVVVVFGAVGTFMLVQSQAKVQRKPSGVATCSIAGDNLKNPKVRVKNISGRTVTVGIKLGMSTPGKGGQSDVIPLTISAGKYQDMFYKSYGFSLGNSGDQDVTFSASGASLTKNCSVTVKKS